MEPIKITKSSVTRINEVDWNNLGFGVYFSDHVFIADYTNGAWGDLRIEPYGPMPISPGMCTLHYGQTIFEGLKAFRTGNGAVNVFRPYKNAARLNHSGNLVCIPPIDPEIVVEGIRQLVKLDQAWIPKKRGHSLYLRPVVFGTDDFLGVHASESYRMIIMTSPVASYYAEGLNPIRIMVSTEWVRAVKGGLGSAKTAANYAASLYGAKKAKEAGFAQVLWLDGVSHEFVDEVGAMNIMFVIDGELVTPTLENGTILAGITRDSVLQLARNSGMKASERSISIEEVTKAHADGRLTEVFGTGTAAVISPVGELVYKGESMIINGRAIGPVAQRFYDTITGIQYGEVADEYGWNEKILL